MQYEWKLEKLARAVAHMHYLEDTAEEIIEQKEIAIRWIRDKFEIQGPLEVYDDNHIEWYEDGAKRSWRWNPVTREGKEFEQFVIPIKRYRWAEQEWGRTQELINKLQEEINGI